VASRIVLGTAGHVDHGKTSLVQALTGIDTDRLAEEKRRGITIELGFAHLSLPGGVEAGVVDVPGHEKFVRAMVAGAFGLDLVVLVVALDEGVMPQTREHLDICQLLGVKRGLVALTKWDLAPAMGDELVQLARADLAEALTGTFLEGAQVLPVSSRTGEGIPALKAALGKLAGEIPERSGEGPAFLPVDRAFTMKGFGTVVTGTLLSGQLHVEDAVDLLPGGPFGLRVRGIQAHGKAQEKLPAGSRTAVNVAGVETAQVPRGTVLCAAGTRQATQMLDVELLLLPSAPAPLKPRSKLLLHLGTAVAEATLTLLDRQELLPGEQAVAQLTLGEPVAAMRGQRFIVRGFAAAPGRGATVGGGAILDPHPRRHRRHKAEAAAVVQTLREGSPEAQLLALWQDAGFKGAALGPLAERLGLSAKAAEKALGLLASRGEVVLFDKAERAGIARGPFQAMQQRAQEAVATHAAAHPLARGLGREELRSRLGQDLPPKLLARVLELLVEQRRATLDGEWVRPFGSKAGAQPQANETLGKLQLALAQAGLAPPRLGELSEQLKLPLAAVREAVGLLRSQGAAVRVTEDMYFDAAAVADLQARLVAHLQQHKEIDIQAFKELVGQTRKWAVPLGEFFDQERVTLRVGDKRLLRGGTP
jgi:selenocysteine-specific elongation factor